MRSVSEMSEAPIVGRYYLVPAIFMSRYRGKELWWPVHGRRHNDIQFFDFELEHYHVDPRFLTAKHVRQIGEFDDIRGWDAIQRSFAAPVHGEKVWSASGGKVSYQAKNLPAPELHKMKCMRLMPEYPASSQPVIHEINAHFDGKRCKRGRLGYVCPHQQYPLGSIVPDENGIITCPLHGLRVRAVDGVCVGSKEAA